MDMEEANGDLLLDHSTRTTTPQHGTPQSDERNKSCHLCSREFCELIKLRLRLSKNDLITINVSGLRFQTFEKTLARFPDSLLGCKFKRERFYMEDSNEYFFDRHRSALISSMSLSVYQLLGDIPSLQRNRRRTTFTVRVSSEKPSNIAMINSRLRMTALKKIVLKNRSRKALDRDSSFRTITHIPMKNCAAADEVESILYIYQSGGRVKRPESVPIDIFLREMRFFQMGDDLVEEFWISEGYEKPKETILPTNTSQRRLWELMEYPDSSLAARIIAFISVAVIIISIVSFCWETVPSDAETTPSTLNVTSGKEEGRTLYNPFFWIELLCIVWFTMELTLRFISCPSKVTFLTSFLNIIDFIAIAPFFVNLIWADASKSSSSMSFTVLRVLRLVRVFRIFKLSRHSAGLQILGKTFRASVQEFCLLVFFMAIALVLFSSGMYFAEQGETNSKFSSIPASFWFVLVTMTTVGYGDLVPLSTQGKIVGSMCALIGVLTLALPVPIIVANFKHFYRQENRLATMCVVGKDVESGEEEDS